MAYNYKKIEETIRMKPDDYLTWDEKYGQNLPSDIRNKYRKDAKRQLAINTIDSDPVGAYENLYDRANSASLVNNKSELYDELPSLVAYARSKLPQDYEQKQVDIAFKAVNDKLKLSKSQILADRDKYFKKLYTEYNTKGKTLDPETRKTVKYIANYLKSDLLKANIDPENLLKDKSIQEVAWDTFVNVINTPFNIAGNVAIGAKNLIKEATGQPVDKAQSIRVWGGDTGSDFIHANYMDDPRASKIIDKIALGTPLTDDELNFYKEMEGNKFGLGLAINLAPLALEVAGSLVSGGATGAGAIGQVASKFDKTGKAIKALEKIGKGGQVLKAVEYVEKTKSVPKVLKTIGSGLKLTGDIIDPIGIIGRGIGKGYNTFRATKTGEKFAKAMNLKRLAKFEDVKALDRVQGEYKALQKASKLITDPVALAQNSEKLKDLESYLKTADKFELTKRGAYVQEYAKELAADLKGLLLKENKLTPRMEETLNLITNNKTGINNLPTTLKRLQSTVNYLVDTAPEVVQMRGENIAKLMEAMKGNDLIQVIRPKFKPFDGKVGEAFDKLTGSLYRTFVSDVRGLPKAVFQKGERNFGWLKGIGDAKANETAFMIKALSKKTGLKKKLLSSILTEVVERDAKTPKEIIDMFTPNSGSAAKKFLSLQPDQLAKIQSNAGDISMIKSFVKQAMDDSVMAEIRTTGNSAVLGMVKQKTLEDMVKAGTIDEASDYYKNMKVRADLTSEVEEFTKEYNKLFEISPQHTKLPALQEEIMKRVDAIKSAFKAQNIDTEAPLEYLLHALTPKAKTYIKSKLAPNMSIKGLINPNINIGNTSQTARNISDLTIAEINQLGNEGKFFLDFKGDIFDDSVDALIKSRWNKTAMSARNGIIANGLLDLGRTHPDVVYIPHPNGKIPAGMEKIKLPDDMIIYVPKDVAKEVTEMLKDVSRNPLSIANLMLNGYDKVLRFWKLSQLMPILSYHTRNILGNLFNNWLAGVNPVSDFGRYKDAVLLQAGRLNDVSFVSPIGKVWTGAEIMEEAGKQDLLKLSGYMREFFNATGATAAKGRITIQDIVGMPEINAKLALFMDGLRKGQSPLEAGLRVKKYLFDYDDLTRFEKGVMRRLIPFYTYTRKNIALQISELPNQLYRNSAYKSIERIRQSFEGRDKDNVVDPRYKPDYLKGRTLKIEEKGKQQSMLNLESLVPMYELSTAVKLLSGQGGDEIAKSLNPLIKSPIEFIANKQFSFDNKPIREYPNQRKNLLGFNVSPEVAYIAGNFRVIKYLDDILGLSGGRGTLLNQISGQGDKETLGIGGAVRRTPELSPTEMGAMLGIGKLSKYDEVMSRYYLQRDLKAQVNTELEGMRKAIKQLQYLYSGDVAPENDMKFYEDAYGTITDKINTAIAEGILDPNDKFDKRLVGYANAVGKELDKWKAQYGKQAQTK